MRSISQICLLAGLIGCGSVDGQVSTALIEGPVDCASCEPFEKSKASLSSLTLFFQSRVDGEIEPCG